MMISGDQIEGAFITAILLGVGKLIALVRGDGNKRLDAELAGKRLAVEADAQEAAQVKDLIPFLQDMINQSNLKMSKMEEVVHGLQDKIRDISIDLAKSQAINISLETRISFLESELHNAKIKNESDTQIIADLNAKVKILEENIEDKNLEILDLRYRIRHNSATSNPIPPILSSSNTDSIGPANCP